MVNTPENRNNLWRELNSKFASNLTLALSQHNALFCKAELQARAIPVVSRILSGNLDQSDWQRDAICMFDEVFADVVCSVYLAACGLDKPAQMNLRRALEIGVATVFLWDLPHMFWGWRNHDKDLNFNDMVEHLGSPGYDSFLRNENSSYTSSKVLDAPVARSLYRGLSNIVHGKMSTFESVLADKFQNDPDDWKTRLEGVCGVEDLLLRLWQNRFRCVSERLLDEFPQLRTQGRIE
jgi:hypothetical protein